MNEVRVGSSKDLVTATDELRRMLDERGVEWSATSGSMGTIWTHWDTFNGCRVHAMDNGDGTVEIFGGWDVTPEQAIAATLGESPCLPHFWTHDGTLHVELPKLPESISVRLPDQRDREVSSARTWQYTRDRGTCHAIVSDNLAESEGMGDAWADCSECGHLLFVLTDPNSEPPNFCPNCGAKVVEPTTNDVDAEVDDG